MISVRPAFVLLFIQQPSSVGSGFATVHGGRETWERTARIITQALWRLLERRYRLLQGATGPSQCGVRVRACRTVRARGELRREGRSGSGHCPPGTPCIGASPALKKLLGKGGWATTQGASAACSGPWTQVLWWGLQMSQKVDSRPRGWGSSPRALSCGHRYTVSSD